VDTEIDEVVNMIVKELGTEGANIYLAGMFGVINRLIDKKTLVSDYEYEKIIDDFLIAATEHLITNLINPLLDKISNEMKTLVDLHLEKMRVKDEAMEEMNEEEDERMIWWKEYCGRTDLLGEFSCLKPDERAFWKRAEIDEYLEKRRECAKKG
jgi:hypothetical protein